MFQILKDLTGECKKGGNTKQFVVLHHTASSKKTTFEGIINFFKKPDYISIHYVVGREGQIIQLIDENDRAFHAGVSEWNGAKDLNNHSIGIEVLSDGIEFTDKQRQATNWLIKDIMKRNGIFSYNVLRHADIAIPRGRKTDIGVNFYVPKTWKEYQASLDSLPDPLLASFEEDLAQKLGLAQQSLGIANNARKQLARQKGITYHPYEIRDTKPL